MHKLISYTLTSALATAGTITPGYPEGYTEGDFQFGRKHYIAAAGGVTYASPNDFTITLGDSTFTVTWKAANTLAAGTVLTIQLEMPGDEAGGHIINLPDAVGGVRRVDTVCRSEVLLINLGTPATLDADAFVKAATSTEAPDTETVTYTPATDGTSPTDGVGTVVTKDGVLYWEMDVPRNIHSVVSHGSSVVAMTITATGLDEFGQPMVEDIAVAATGTSQTDNGVKAFKWVSSIALTAAADAEANTVNVGFGDVLGLPVHVPSAAMLLKEFEDGAAPSAGSLVAGLNGISTATSADVRGTYDANSASNGQKNFSLLVAVPDPHYYGAPQYAG